MAKAIATQWRMLMRRVIVMVTLRMNIDPVPQNFLFTKRCGTLLEPDPGVQGLSLGLYVVKSEVVWRACAYGAESRSLSGHHAKYGARVTHRVVVCCGVPVCVGMRLDLSYDKSTVVI